jgi:predicted phosphodiesterase
MHIAVIADIHGNMPALEAVLADIQRRNVGRMINLGDSVSGPLWPREVCDLLMARDDLTIRGNHDRWISGPDPSRMGASDRVAYSQLEWITVIRSLHCRPPPTRIRAFLPAMAHRLTTTSTSSRKSLAAG